MTMEKLDSDRINYLIWRYLMESDYQETAAKLQKEWDKPDPQQLPFAPHVQIHALVSTVNRGLLYNVQERDPALAGCVSGVFGPLRPTSPVPEENLEIDRKRQIDSDQPPTQSGPPAKKPRLSNGYENDFTTTPMEVDDDNQMDGRNGPANGDANGDENAYPSPEQVPSPMLATIGPDQGTQIDKVNELTPETTFLELFEDPSRNAVVLQCEFSPRDAMILAAAGTDALARMWTLSRTLPETGSDSPAKPVLAPHINLLDDGVSTQATCLSWASDGSMLALSSEPPESGNAKIEFWAPDGARFASFNGFDPSIIALRWNPQNNACLAMSPLHEGKGALISVLSPYKHSTLRFPLPDHSLLDQPLDAAWTSDIEFIICGGTLLQAFRCADNEIVPGIQFETRPGESLSKVVYDWRSSLLATASDSGTIDIWDQSGRYKSFNAHQGVITSLSWQPLPSPVSMDADSERLLASAGEDGAISVWNARASDAKSRSSMTMNSAVVAMSFTPDGAFIAGATSENVFIWKTDDVSIPRATWTRPVEAGWRTPLSHDSSSDEDQFSLCWDANGQKLAYAVNSRLAVIAFRR